MKSSKKNRIILFIFVFLISFGCAQKNEQGSPSHGVNQINLSGMVETGGALKDGISITAASIDFIPEKSTDGSYTTFTDSTGYYTMTVPSGTYNVVAEGRNLQKAVRSKVRLSSGTVLNFVLTATGDLAGRLAYYESSVEGMVVFLYGTQYMAVTDMEGFFKVTGIPVGVYKIGIIIPDEDGGLILLPQEITITAGTIRDLGTIDGAGIDQFAFIEYLNPYKIEESHDPNHPMLIHRFELFDECSNDKLGIVVKFQREMDAGTVVLGESLSIEAPAAFAERNLHWEYVWGYYERDDMGEGYENTQGEYFYPSPCHLTILPKTDDGLIADEELPVGKYVLRLSNAIKDKCGNPLNRVYIYSFNIREMMRWAVNDHFLPDGAKDINVGEGIMAQFTNIIDRDTAQVTITPSLQGEELVWFDGGLLIKGLYNEGITYTATLQPGVKTIHGDPIVNTDLFTVQFTTAAPHVAGMLPRSGTTEFGIDEPVTLIFNAVTDRDSVEKSIRVYDDTNNIVYSLYIDVNTPAPFFKLAWVYPEYNDDSPHGNSSFPDEREGCQGCGLGSECGEEECCSCIGDHLAIFFPRQYNHLYRIELEAGAFSSHGGEIAAFAGSFRTKIPRLIDWDIKDYDQGDFDEYDEGFRFKYNVVIDPSQAMLALVTEDGTSIPLGINHWYGSELNLIPAQLPHSTSFVLSLQGIKAHNGYPIEDQTFTFSTPGLAIVDTYPYQGQTNYYLNEDGSNQFVTIKFNGPLSDEMQQAVENSLTVIGKYYDPEIDSNSVPDNYPDPLFIRSTWKFGWSSLQVAFTMDYCTNYRIHFKTDTSSGALLYDHDMDPVTPDEPFIWLNDDLIFSTQCDYEGPGNIIPPLLYRTEPQNGTTEINVDNSCFRFYFATPVQYGADIEVWQDGNHQLMEDDDYWLNYNSVWDCPFGHQEFWGWNCEGSSSSYVTQLSLCFNQLEQASHYTIIIKNAWSSPSSDAIPFSYNLPYTYSFSTESPKIHVEADNNFGTLQFKTSIGYFKTQDLQNMVSFQPELTGEWEFRDNNGFIDQNSLDEGIIGYATEAILHYKPIPYALLKVNILDSLDGYAPIEGEEIIWELKGQYANTPSEWILQIHPDNVLPKLNYVEPENENFLRVHFSMPVDAETALDPNHYVITYQDELGQIHNPEVKEILIDNGDPTCPGDPFCPDMVRLEMIEPFTIAEHTLQVKGVKSCSQRYEIMPKDGVAKFIIRGQVEEVYGLESIMRYGG